MIYIITFFSSVLCFYGSEKVKNRYLRIGLAVCGILIPCLLAGLRSSIVGTDVRVYGKYAYNEAIRSSSFISYYGKFSDSLLGDMGYYLITYIAAKIIPHYHFGLLIYSLIPFTCYYLGIRKFNLKEGTPIWLFMALCYFSLYNNSLNLIRQSIAIGVLFYAFAEFALGKKSVGIGLWILAVLFHSSALIGAGIFILYTYFKQQISDRWYTGIWKSLLFIAVFFGFLMIAPSLLRQLVESGLVRDNYLMYLDGGDFRIDGQMNWNNIVAHIATVLGIAAFFKPLYDRRMNPLFYLITSLLVIFADYLPLISQYADRIGLYLIPITLVALANIKNCLPKWWSVYWCFMLLVIFCYQWTVTIVIQGFHETYPYEFAWQDDFTDEFISDENREFWSRN